MLFMPPRFWPAMKEYVALKRGLQALFPPNPADYWVLSGQRLVLTFQFVPTRHLLRSNSGCLQNAYCIWSNKVLKY